MTDRKPLIEALKSAATMTLIDPKNWNVGLQAEASIRAVLAELDRQGYSVCREAGTMVDGVVPLIAAIDRAILKAATSRADRGPAEDAAAIRRAVLAELDRQGWQCMPREPTPEMWTVGVDTVVRFRQLPFHPDKITADMWDAMRKAAPKLGGE